jgi:hypothetical protein
MGPRFRGDDDRFFHEPSIPSRGINDIFQITAGLEALDLARDIFRYLVGIGVGGVVRRQHDLWMGPEPAVRRQRFLGEDIQRRGPQRAVVEARQNVGFVLLGSAPGIVQHRGAHRAVAAEFCKKSAIENVPCIRCQR